MPSVRLRSYGKLLLKIQRTRKIAVPDLHRRRKMKTRTNLKKNKKKKRRRKLKNNSDAIYLL